MRLASAAIFGFMTFAGVMPAIAQQQQKPYIDDRSSPQALVQSLYNAINRKEFARAYSYFSVPPQPSLNEYAKGCLLYTSPSPRD